jgi:hypothetical protein
VRLLPGAQSGTHRKRWSGCSIRTIGFILFELQAGSGVFACIARPVVSGLTGLRWKPLVGFVIRFAPLLVRVRKGNTMKSGSKHEHFCFAGQPAPCEGYFLNDLLPCVCGAEGDVVTALSRLAVPALGGTPVSAELAAATSEPVEDEAA